jgi:uncharacterized Zn finger protein (UPF0148 family)
MYETFQMSLSVRCDPCGAALPVNGVTSRVTCASCGRVSGVGRSLWRRVFSADDFAATFVGRGRRGGDLLMPKAKYSLQRAPLRCRGCKGGALDPAALAAAIDDGRCQCPGCGSSVPVRAADDLCRSINPRARFVVDEQLEPPGQRRRDGAPTAGAVTCSQCGAPLEHDGSKRLVSCAYCSAKNTLSAAERGRRPNAQVRSFFLVCEYDEAAITLARLTDNRFAREVAGQSGHPAEVYQALADRSLRIRTALAGNHAAPPAILSRLLDDTDERIVRALVGNPAVAAERLSEQATAGDWYRRLLAASHPGAPPALLQTLARDQDDRVSAAADRRLSELRARGIDVGDPVRRGLFGRIFGR